MQYILSGTFIFTFGLLNPNCPQEEPTVITLDNVADYLHRPGGRDVFDVNVQAVIKTRDSPNSNKQFYLDHLDV